MISLGNLPRSGVSVSKALVALLANCPPHPFTWNVIPICIPINQCSFHCPLANTVNYYILSSGRSSFQSHAPLTDELQTWQLTPLCLLAELSKFTCGESQETWEGKNIWSTGSVRCWGGKEGTRVWGGAWFLPFPKTQSLLNCYTKPLLPGNAPGLIRKWENKASWDKGRLSGLEVQRPAKPLTLSRNENINGETPKENVFHMHRPLAAKEYKCTWTLAREAGAEADNFGLAF